MIKPINNESVKIKNLLGIIEDPTIEDLLFEIVSFLDHENRLTDKFTKKEVSLKTKYRFNKSLDLDLEKLVSKGYLNKLSKTKFQLLKNLWE